MRKNGESNNDNFSSNSSNSDDNEEVVNRSRWKSKQKVLNFDKMIVNEKETYIV